MRVRGGREGERQGGGERERDPCMRTGEEPCEVVINSACESREPRTALKLMSGMYVVRKWTCFGNMQHSPDHCVALEN